MKTEGELNGKLGKMLNKKSPELKYVKVADKFTLGISDFLIWWRGMSAAVEVKFIKVYPKRGSSKLLSHPFSGTQLSFLFEMECSGAFSFGLVGVDCEKRLYLVPREEIPKTGNWEHLRFKESQYTWYDYKDIDGLLEGIFGKA